MNSSDWYELYHHGVKGQHWGDRRWQNPDGSLTPEGYVHYGYAKKETRAFNRRHKNSGITVDEAYELDAKRLDKRNKYIAKNLQKEVDRYSKGKRAKSPEGLGNDYDNWNKTIHDPKIIGGMIIQQLLFGGAIGNTGAIAVRNARSRENLIITGKYYLNKLDYDSMKKSGNLEKIWNENFDAATDIARFNRQILDRNKGKKNTGISIKNPKYVMSEENRQRLKKEAEKKNLKHSSIDDDFLAHFGIPGQKWGIRRWQNADGSLTPEGRIHYGVNGTKNAKEADDVMEQYNKEGKYYHHYTTRGLSGKTHYIEELTDPNKLKDSSRKIQEDRIGNYKIKQNYEKVGYKPDPDTGGDYVKKKIKDINVKILLPEDASDESSNKMISKAKYIEKNIDDITKKSNEYLQKHYSATYDNYGGRVGEIYASPYEDNLKVSYGSTYTQYDPKNKKIVSFEEW